MKIKKNKSLKELTTWRVGGPADFFIETKTEKDIKDAIKYAQDNKLNFIVIGNGSNILVNDKGFRGLVIKVSNNDTRAQGKNIICGAGIQLSQVLKFAKDNKLYGTEFLWGIPGTLGGAITGNAGMNNQEIKDILKEIKIINSKGIVTKLKRSNIKFSYRNSSLKRTKYIILEIVLQLSKQAHRSLDNLAKNRLNQPKGFSAGSVFKNPKQGVSAGELIDKAGLKGKKIGGAQISKIHGNFILNINNAKASDISRLISLIQKEVINKFGIQLKREVRILGEKKWE